MSQVKLILNMWIVRVQRDASSMVRFTKISISLSISNILMIFQEIIDCGCQVSASCPCISERDCHNAFLRADQPKLRIGVKLVYISSTTSSLTLLPRAGTPFHFQVLVSVQVNNIHVCPSLHEHSHFHPKLSFCSALIQFTYPCN